jgi:hypothetical protein
MHAIYRPLGSFAARFTLTLGLYWLWLLASWAGEINRLYGSRRWSPVWIVGTTLLTLGIAGFYYHYKLTGELPMAATVHGTALEPELSSRVAVGLGLSVIISFFSGGLALFLSIAVLGWAAWQTQAALNRIAIAALPNPADGVAGALPG